MNTRQQPFDSTASAQILTASRLAEKFSAVRAKSLELIAPLSEEDCCAQSMPDASPAKWHLAHTTWFFETFVLEKYEEDFHPFHAAFRVLFNSYYNGVGEKHPRPQRGMLTRPALSLVREYRADVDQRMVEQIARFGGDQDLRALIELGLNHEQQHQELLLTDLKHLLSLNPLLPVYRDIEPSPPSRMAPLDWVEFAAGVVEVGATASPADGERFCFDNELPRHKQYLSAYRLATRLVTNGEYLRFIEAGGYREPSYWLSEGWDWVRANAIEQPIYWSREAQTWREFTLAGARPLDLASPLAHISYFEADAYARFADARLPTEGEWEHAAAQHTEDDHPRKGNFLDDALYHPVATNATGVTQMFGDLWEWTSSSYSPYPGFVAPLGAIGEYNGKFMVNQYVLRGGSCATPREHIRASYRNFFPTSARWQFSGIRLAKDA
ncbi:MAG: ergothioneine biosynthesis protein EgtB [Burkholderiales bacterium]